MMRLWPFVFNGDRGNFARIAVVGAAADSQATNRKDLGRGNGRDLAAKSMRIVITDGYAALVTQHLLA
jgi:hypothetical protein